MRLILESSDDDLEIRSILTRRWREAHRGAAWSLDARMLADRLRTRRLALGWSQTYLAAVLGTSQSSICQWERGGIDVQTSSLARWAEALGLRLSLTVEDEWEGGDGDRAEPE